MALKNQQYILTKFWGNLPLAVTLVALLQMILDFDRWSDANLGWSNILFANPRTIRGDS